MFVRCFTCRVVVRARVPRGGDGSAVRPYMHRIEPSGAWCYGSFDTLDCRDAYDDREDVPALIR